MPPNRDCAPPVISSPLCKARAAWQWWNYLRSKVPADKRILNIALDETSIPYWLGDRKGVVMPPGHQHASTPPPRQHATLGTRRAALTHVALVCVDTTIQAMLPQVLVCNERHVTAAQYAAIQEFLPRNVWVVRQKSAWNNHLLLCQILELLHDILEAVPHFQVILSMDVAKCHLNPAVIDACNRFLFFYYFTPAKCTPLLAPPDTHVFGRYKRYIGMHYVAKRLAAPDGCVDVVGLIRLLV